MGFRAQARAAGARSQNVSWEGGNLTRASSLRRGINASSGQSAVYSTLTTKLEDSPDRTPRRRGRTRCGTHRSCRVRSCGRGLQLARIRRCSAFRHVWCGRLCILRGRDGRLRVWRRRHCRSSQSPGCVRIAAHVSHSHRTAARSGASALGSMLVYREAFGLSTLLLGKLRRPATRQPRVSACGISQNRGTTQAI
jgi:hypothetical protein